MPFRCREKECAKRFSAKTGTVMEGSKLGFQVWMIATYLLSTSLKSVSSMKLHHDLNINQRSAWFLAHQIIQQEQATGWTDIGAWTRLLLSPNNSPLIGSGYIGWGSERYCKVT